MLDSSSWLTPTLFGMPYFHKPPLMYWVDMLALHLLGPTPLALRAAPLLGGWLLYRVVERPFLDLRDRWIPSQFTGAARATTAGQRSPQHA